MDISTWQVVVMELQIARAAMQANTKQMQANQVTPVSHALRTAGSFPLDQMLSPIAWLSPATLDKVLR
jgi:hypothetical protein